MFDSGKMLTLKQPSDNCSRKKAKSSLEKFFPVLHWLPKYPVREWLLGDIIAGISVGIIQMPQGLAYSLLAAVPPVFGLYSSFYPVLTYFLFGTSRHVSIGGFAVLCVMIGNVAEDMVPSNFFIEVDNITNETVINTEMRDRMRVDVVASLTLITGIIQVLLGLTQFGFVVNYLSGPLVCAYTTAAALHVTLSQLKYIFGVNVKRYSGPASFIFTFIDLCTSLAKTNIGTLVVSIVSFVVLIAAKRISATFSSRMPVPFPSEFVVLIISTAISAGVNLNSQYNTDVVGAIQTGLKAPSFPRSDNIGTLVGSAFAIAVVGYGLSISLGKMFGMKHGYSVDSNQELIALGMSNLVGGFFQCYAISSSMSRSLILESTGGKSQVSGAISALVILIVLLKIGELFQQLPKAVLAAIVIVNLVGMYRQFGDTVTLWKTNKAELLVWVVTLLSTVLLNMDMGLVVSLGFSLLTVIFRTQLPHYSILGQVLHSDIYRDMEQHKEIEEIPGIKIFKSSTTLYFANSEQYVNALIKKTSIDVSKLIAAKRKATAKWEKKVNQLRDKSKKKEKKRDLKAKHGPLPAISTVKVNDFAVNVEPAVQLNCEYSNANTREDHSLTALGIKKPQIHSIILDLSTLNFVDSDSIKVLKNIFKDFGEIEINVYLACCQYIVIEQLEKGGFFGKEITKSHVFPSVHDAVVHCTTTSGTIAEVQKTSCGGL
ncbi:solute carrier family 26 member 6-like [Protopterus annectens]|uniref:solute carrier family 26 member 6-like n=1 Tax=Protopterus annectens TaxID=7888 RepID=UPI001CFBB496|nr:solute carrier family 26 member 6-like [Protopterus annectens]